MKESDGLPLKNGNYIKIVVEDQGLGIGGFRPERILDPYFTTKELGSQKGMGLGLAICHSIVKSHRGFITATSALGCGTSL